VLDALAHGRAFKASRTSFVSPTYVPDLCHTILDLLVDGETGLWHLANQGRMSWYDLAVRVAEEAGFDPAGIKAEEGPPADNSLSSKHGAQIRAVDEAIRDYVAAVRDRFQAPALAVAAE
jgi:dTDP-4-dehydrorhamnose reductase